MLIKTRNHSRRGPVRTCPHCHQALAGQLVHIEGPTFLCYRCLREIHIESRNRNRLSLLPGRRTRREPAAG
jgi:hypothetical protein